MRPVQALYISLLFVAIIQVFFSCRLSAQPAVITGQAKGQPDELVRIIIYADQFSRLQKTIASSYTDENGNFSFNIELDETTYASFALGLKKAEFYLKPGATYSFTIPLDTVTQTGSIFDEVPLQFTYQADDEGLSDALTALNVEHNRFMYEFADKIYRGRDKSPVVHFMNEVETRFEEVNDPYFKGYKTYIFAALEWISKMKSDRLIVQEYFVNHPILYQNIQYTELFAEFFKSYFGYNDFFKYDELVEAINYGDGLKSVTDLIIRDTLFAGDITITELIATQLLSAKYYSSDIDRGKVIALFNELGNTGSTQEIREIASNYIKKLKKLEKGSVAPGFNLADGAGDKISLQQLAGKHILLGFVKPECKMCLEHFQLLDELQKQFQGDLQIVIIVYGNPFRDVVMYGVERGFDWPILNLDKNILLLEAYNIRAYPSYVLLNPDGTIGMANAPMPDENLGLFIRRQISVFEKKQAEKGK